MELTPSALLLASTVLLAFGFLVWGCCRRPLWGIVLFAGARLWESLSTDTAGLSATGVDLMAADAVALVLLCAAAPRLLSGGRLRLPAPVALVALCVLGGTLVVSAARGIAVVGLQRTGLDARPVFQLCAVALFAATLPATRATLTFFVRLWACYAIVLCGAVLLWWLDTGIGGAGQNVAVDGVLTEARPLSAMESLVIGQAAVLLLYRYGASMRARVLAVSMVVIVILMQSRSGWIACAAMCACLLVRRGRAGASRLATLAQAAGVVSFLVLAGLLNQSSTVADSLLTSSQDTTTFTWRVDNWLSALPVLHSPGDWMLGVPLGGDTRRLVPGGLTEVSMHNHFLDVLVHQGLLGVAALVALYGCVWRRASRVPDGTLLRALVLGLVTFSITYPLRPEQALLLGLLAVFAGRRPDPPVVSLPLPARPILETPCPAVPR